MAASRPEAVLFVRLPALLLAGFFVSAAPLVTAQTPATKSAEIVLDAASSEMDYRSNTLLFQDLLITQGSTRVKAARARSTGLDFAASSWTLSDGVRLEIDGGVMTSSEATVLFRDNRVLSATIRGENTAFEQRLRNGNKASGKAREIIYDAATATVVLQGEALLSDGRNDIRGDKLVYDLAAERVSAGNTAAGDRVRITIRPPADTADSARPPR
ncbi:MAG: lipopolysaccharide transport periplasmic protein LptA [Pseudomonadota bacterium]|jgi:lipopolysaccharide transport protein LptA